MRSDPDSVFKLWSDPDPGFKVRSDPGFKMKSDPDQGFKMKSDPDPGFKMKKDPNPTIGGREYNFGCDLSKLCAPPHKRGLPSTLPLRVKRRFLC